VFAEKGILLSPLQAAGLSNGVNQKINKRKSKMIQAIVNGVPTGSW
jgi:hypothetical protein